MSVDPGLVLRPRDGLQSARFDSAGRGQEYVVTLPSGSHFRITERMHEFIQQVDGRRTLGEIADDLGRRWQRPLTHEQAWDLAQRYLAPHGLLQDSPEPPRAQQGSRTLSWHRRLLSARALEPVTRIGQHAFSWPVVVAAVALCALAHVEAYARAGAVGPGLAQALGDGTFLLSYGLVLASVLIHEFGHASACRRFGESYGDVGLGLYLIFPVLYVDVTRIWRLGRWQRVVVDLGGVYFQSFVATLYGGLFVLTGDWVWFVALAQIDALILLALLPLGRFDGYWLVCDALGVANPWRELKRRTANADAGFTPITPAARAGVCAYGLAVIGTLAFGLVRLASQLPEMGPRFARALAGNLDKVSLAWQAADAVGLVAQLVRLVAPVALLVGVLLGLQRAFSRLLHVRRRSSGRGPAPAP